MLNLKEYNFDWTENINFLIEGWVLDARKTVVSPTPAKKNSDVLLTPSVSRNFYQIFVQKIIVLMKFASFTFSQGRPQRQAAPKNMELPSLLTKVRRP